MGEMWIVRPIVWLCGRPGSGKTSLAVALWRALDQLGIKASVLDSDAERLGPMCDLGFEDEDRLENITRLRLFAEVLQSRCVLPIVAAVTPTNSLQRLARRNTSVLFVYVAKVNKELWPGTSFENPHEPDLTLYTVWMSLEECTQQLLKEVTQRCF